MTLQLSLMCYANFHGYNVVVENCRLYTDEVEFHLAATLHDFVGEDTIIEVKFPSVLSKISPHQRIIENFLSIAVLDENNSMSL